MGLEFMPDNKGSKLMWLDRLPDICPWCKTAIAPERQYCSIMENDDQDSHAVNVFYGCPKCAQIFCLSYPPHATKDSTYIHIRSYEGRWIPPLAPSSTLNDERITSISQTAVDIFRQAEKAEAGGLSEIAGMGYRKSLECLIKDSLVQLGIKTQEAVVKLDLIEAIKEFQGAPNLYKVASQARVIGNDYAHYQAKYEGYDIDTLRKLLSMTFHWLQMEFDSRELDELHKKGQAGTP